MKVREVCEGKNVHTQRKRERFFYCKGGEAEIVAHLIVTRVQFPWPQA